MPHPTEHCELTNLCMLTMMRAASLCRTVPIPVGRVFASPAAMWNRENPLWNR